MFYKLNTWIKKWYISVIDFFLHAIILGIKYGFFFYLFFNITRIYFNIFDEIGQNEVITVAFVGFVILITLQNISSKNYWITWFYMNISSKINWHKWFYRLTFFLTLYIILIIIKTYLNILGKTSQNDIIIMAIVGNLSLIAMQFFSRKWFTEKINWVNEPKWLNRCVFYCIFFVIIYKISKFFISEFVILQGIPKEDISSFFEVLVSSEATVLALIVTLSLVAVQLAASSYSARIIEVFRRTPDIWILLIIYIFAIFYGLIMLSLMNKSITLKNSLQESLFNFKMYLSFSFFVFLAIGPYIWNTLELLRPSTIINLLAQEITVSKIKKINDKDSNKGLIIDNGDPLLPIIDIVNASIMRYDFATVRFGIDVIKKRAIFLTNMSVLRHSLLAFFELGELYINRRDIKSSQIVAENLFEIGYTFAKKKSFNRTYLSEFYLKEIGISAIKQGKDFELFSKNVVDYIGKIGKAKFDIIIYYSLNWAEIPGNGNEQLIKFLEETFDIYWVENAKIIKYIDDVRVFNKNSSLSLSISRNRDPFSNEKIIIHYDSDIAHKFSVRKENGWIHIYDDIDKEVYSENGKYGFDYPLKFLKEIGLIAAEKRLKIVVKTVIFWFGETGKVAEEKKHTELISSVIDCLGEITIKAAETGKELEEETKQGITNLETVGLATSRLGFWGLTQHITGSLEEVCKKSIKQNLENVTIKAVESIGIIGKVAAKSQIDYKDLCYAVEQIVLYDLLDIGEISAKEGTDDTTKQVIKSFYEIGKVIAKKDEFLTKNLIENLGIIGFLSIQNNLINSAEESILSIGKVGFEAAENGRNFETAIDFAIYKLGENGEMLAKEEKYIGTSNATYYLGIIGEKVIESGLEKKGLDTLNKIEKILAIIKKNNLHTLIYKVEDDMKKITKALNNFSKIYIKKLDKNITDEHIIITQKELEEYPELKNSINIDKCIKQDDKSWYCEVHQDEWVRTRDFIEKKQHKYLFSMNIDFEKYLNKGVINTEIARMFDFKPYENFDIKIKQIGIMNRLYNRWIIVDAHGSSIYNIWKENNELKVYDNRIFKPLIVEIEDNYYNIII